MNKSFRYQHIYSSVDGKAPSAETLYTAEIAVNGAAGNEKLFIKNSSGDVVNFDRIIVDDNFDSGSTNPIQNKVVDARITENEEVVAAALNQLNQKKLDKSAYTEDIANYYKKEETSSKTEISDALDLKQDKLTAGSGITITDDNVISAESGNKVVELKQAEYDALTDKNPDTFYIITDAQAVDVSKYVSSGSVDTTASTSAYTLSFSGNSGNLFNLEIPKGGDGKKMIEGTNIKITSGETADTIAVSASTAITSASTEVVTSKAIYDALDEKLDKDNYVNQHYPKGSVLVTTTYTNPSTFIGGQWQLIGGQDADKNYYPAFAIATDTGKEEIDESLPNIKGVIPMHNQGAISISGSALFTSTGTGDAYTVDAANGSSTKDKLNFDASSASTVYQDGAQVNVKAIKLFFWERVDDSEIVEAFTPFTAGSGITIDNGVISSEWKNFVDIQHPQGSVYITYEYKNPSTWLGGEWELIGGSDDSKTYWPAMAIATDAAGTTVNETLPNIKGNISLGYSGLKASVNGAFSTSNPYTYGQEAHANDGSYLTFSFNAANSNSTYQDGAQVAVESIKLFYWRRTDNATIAQSVVPFDFINTIDKDNPSTTKSVTEKGIVDYVKSLIIDLEHPIGSTYIQMASDADPNTKYSGTTWVEDTSYDGRYFMVDSTTSAGTEIAESLPNIGGYWTDQAGGGNSLPKYGAFAGSNGYSASCWGTDAGGKTSRVDFKASKGQLNASGGYVSEADSVYKNGASVHPLSVTIKIWIRTA